MKTSFILTLIALFVISMTAKAGDDPQRNFVGADKCKPCHSSDKKGAQYKVWKASKHAEAYATLATDKAKEFGAKVGVTNPQEDAKCLKCHVDGFGVDAKFLTEKYNKADGVSCESCHGAGGDYIKMQVMKDITAKTIEGATVGLVKPDEATCKKCHNEESPTFAGFNYDEMYKKIAHPMPK